MVIVSTLNTVSQQSRCAKQLLEQLFALKATLEKHIASFYIEDLANKCMYTIAK